MEDLFYLLSPKSICIFILVLARYSGMLFTAPFFSTFPIPMLTKAGLIALLAFLTYPIVLNTPHFVMPNNLLLLALLMCKEVFIGFLIGYCTNLIFVGVQMAGQFLSVQMGLSAGSVVDPITRQQVPEIGQLYMFLAGIVFLAISGHQWLFSGVYESYYAIPPGPDFHLTAKMINEITIISGQVFAIAFKLIMPLYGVLFITDIALGFVSKMMPQMNIFMVSLPLKIYVGLALLLLFMSTTGNYLANLIRDQFQYITGLFT